MILYEISSIEVPTSFTLFEFSVNQKDKLHDLNYPTVFLGEYFFLRLCSFNDSFCLSVLIEAAFTGSFCLSVLIKVASLVSEPLQMASLVPT